MEIELNKTYDYLHFKLGVGRDIISIFDVTIIDITPFDKSDLKVIAMYEKMRLKDRHKYSKNVDYFVKGILKLKDNKEKTLFFVCARDGDWVSVDEYQNSLDINGKIVKAYKGFSNIMVFDDRLKQ